MKRTFIYKQTHEGDPAENGCWGIHNCMGRMRNLEYEAVVGVGGIGSYAKKSGIAGKVTWIGIGPRRRSMPYPHGNLVTFDQFLYLGQNGPDFSIEAPILARRMYSKHAPRFLLDDLDFQEQVEIEKLLAYVGKISFTHQSQTKDQSRCVSRRPRSKCRTRPPA